ncbi:chain-length determining protein [Falsochrobactrum sp. TDYN1]|uniref:Chain-length determining protein n=1 Tax=Falsochrobactrum tianjinense TaxID=2706015 RepID=A0A949UU72_9HYPH|nr:Wzz/FepE/Etk N-terminal domain-containing protein [Falsochrobactrum sp. TDYN1]MBV2142798.1 chain-length determining protein [Falsochrobactrum sp. TDYN1]
MSRTDDLSKDADIDIGALFEGLRRSWLLILGGAALMAVLAWVFCLLLTPDYRAETRILIEVGESIYTRPDGETAAERPFLDPEGVKSQVEVVASADLLKQVSDRLRLTEKEGFVSANTKPWAHILILLGMRTNPADLSEEERVLQKLRKNLEVFNIAGSRVIVIQYMSSDAREAADIANTVADAYIALQRAAKLQSTDDATGWLAPEIEDLRNKVRNSERKVANYRAAHGLLTGQANSTIASQQLSEVSSELTRIRSERASAEAKATSVRTALEAGIAVDTLPDVIASPMMQRLAERRVQLNTQIADLSVTLLDGHPRIRSLRSQFADLDRQIAAEARKLLASLENEVTAAKLREDELNRELNRVKAQAAQADTQEVELRALEREAAAQRQLLETYLTRYREAASRTDRNYVPADARIFSRADAPGVPYYPKTLPIVSSTFVAGLLLLSIFVLLREMFSGRAFIPLDRDGVEAVEEIEMPVIAAATDMASVPPSENEFVYEKPTPQRPLSAAEPHSPNSVGSVADRLLEGELKRVIIVSPEGDQAALGSMRLVRELADRGKRVILIDMTAYGVLGTAMLDGKNLPGITELLGGQKRLNDVIHNDHFSQAHIMPLGLADPEDAMRSVERLPFILDALETVYDFVLVECGTSTSRQIHRIADGPVEVIMNIVDPDDDEVVRSALDMDQGGYEDVIILMDVAAEGEA